MTDILLVRLKPYDPRRDFVLRRFTYAGIRFQDERGWYRVERKVGEHLRAVRTVPTDKYAPLAFDVCTEAEAKALDAGESEAAKVKRNATDDLKVTTARGTVTTDDVPKNTRHSRSRLPRLLPASSSFAGGKRGKRERE